MALPPAPGWVGEFKDFISKGNVLDLAVGVIIGAAFGSIVTSLVADIINPLIGVLLGGVDFSNVFFALNGQRYATIKQAKDAGVGTVNIGLFVNAVIQFVIMAFVIFWVVKVVGKFRRPPVVEVVGPTQTEVLLTEIRDLLRK